MAAWPPAGQGKADAMEARGMEPLSVFSLFLLLDQGPALGLGPLLLGLVSVCRPVKTLLPILQISQLRLSGVQSHTRRPYGGSQECAQPVS